MSFSIVSGFSSAAASENTFSVPRSIAVRSLASALRWLAGKKIEDPIDQGRGGLFQYFPCEERRELFVAQPSGVDLRFCDRIERVDELDRIERQLGERLTRFDHA